MIKSSTRKKNSFFLRRVQFLGQVIIKDVIQPVKKKVDDHKAIKSPENSRDVMSVRLFGILYYVYTELTCRLKAFL